MWGWRPGGGGWGRCGAGGGERGAPGGAGAVEPSSARSAPQRPAVPRSARQSPAVPRSAGFVSVGSPRGAPRMVPLPTRSPHFLFPPPASNPPFPPPSFSLSLFFIYFFPIISSGSAEAVLPSSLPPPPPSRSPSPQRSRCLRMPRRLLPVPLRRSGSDTSPSAAGSGQWEVSAVTAPCRCPSLSLPPSRFAPLRSGGGGEVRTLL